MKVVIHTKYGVFKSLEAKYKEEEFTKLTELLEKVHTVSHLFVINTSAGELYMSKDIIADSLFILQK
jgi:arginine repressor